MDVVDDVQKDIDALRHRDDSVIGKIERNRWIAHNAYVIAGTRIPVSSIKDFHDAGYSVTKIQREFPDLTPEDIEAAIAHKEEAA